MHTVILRDARMTEERVLLITSALLKKRGQAKPGKGSVRDVLAAAKAISSNFDLAIEISAAKGRGDWQHACSLVLDGALHKIKEENARLRCAGKKTLESEDVDRIISDESGRLCTILIEVYKRGVCGRSLHDWKRFAEETRETLIAGLTEVLLEKGGETISFLRITPDELAHLGALWIVAEYRAETEIARMESNETALEKLRKTPVS